MAHTLHFAYKHEKAIFMFGLLCLLIMVSSYLWCVKTAVAMVALRQNLEEANIELGSEIAVLGNQYLEKTNRITVEMAYGLGFVDDAKFIAYALPQGVEPTLGQVSFGNDL